MVLKNDGFYHPAFRTGKTNASIERKTLACCPGINLIDPRIVSCRQPWYGLVKELYCGWAIDEEVRFKGSSGGVVSALAIHLLEDAQIDAVLHVGASLRNPLRNELQISRTASEVLKNSGSRYAPAALFKGLRHILDASKDRFLFIGKPCDTTALRLWLNQNPGYSTRFLYTIAIFCAGIPSYNGTNEVLKSLGIESKVESLRYRGEGWPGYFKVVGKQGRQYQMGYNDAWGRILNKHLHFRCKICPDGIGLSADIVAGDAWKIKDGHPDFEERDGRSLLLVRTDIGLKLINRAVRKCAIHVDYFNRKNIQTIQYYQYERTFYAGWRIFGVQAMTGFLLRPIASPLFKNAFLYPPLQGLRQMIGSLKRFSKKIRLTDD
jgi:coenzyme F420 hydrogenase subunit beta